MKDNAPDDTVVERLEFALETASLPKAALDHAAHLLKRLSSPVRVSLLGRPGSGKSELLNMFVGRRVLSKDAKHATLELGFGETEQIIATLVNGKKVTRPGTDVSVDLGGAAAFIRVELPLPLLQRVSFLEVVTDGSIGELKSAIDWAVRRTDIALWCTQAFTSDEKRLWTRVPDSLKDHAFLVLTKADVLSAENELSARITQLETVVAEEFHSLFAVATLQAIKAHKPDGALDEAVYHASGGGALSAEILRHAERGRRADIDSAHLFLARYQVRPVEVKTAPKPDAPAAPAAKAQSAPAPEKVVETPKEAANFDAAPSVENIELFTNAARFLRKRGDSLTGVVADAEPGKVAPIVAQCVEVVDQLIDQFAQDDMDCPAADAFIDDLTEAQELMVLMQVESGDAPAADAVTLLLQLRRDIESNMAA